MFGRYVGYVSGDDGMYGFLSSIIREQLGVYEPNPAFRAFRLRGRNEVYAYEEKHSRARVICKFYGELEFTGMTRTHLVVETR